MSSTASAPMSPTDLLRCEDSRTDPAGTCRLLRDTDDGQCDASNETVERPFVLQVNSEFTLQLCQGCAEILQLRLEAALGPIKPETEA